MPKLKPKIHHDFRADLHSHTHCSDGSLTPEALVHLAVAANLQGLSITDHDTVAAYKSALPLAHELGLKLLSGIELSAYHESNSIHILGYGFDLQNTQLLDFCERLAQARIERNRLILEKLARCRFIISENELNTAYPNRIIGRPHIAEIMVKKGYVKDLKAAFLHYLGDKGRCKTTLQLLSVDEAIVLIHQAGGMAVLAHPHRMKNQKLVKKLLNGTEKFDGIETYYGLMPPHLEKPIIELAQTHNLIMTGGSDFHGAFTPHLRLGCSFSTKPVFEQFYELFTQNNKFF